MVCISLVEGIEPDLAGQGVPYCGQPFRFPYVMVTLQGPAASGNTAGPLGGAGAGEREQRQDQQAVGAADLIRASIGRGYD